MDHFYLFANVYRPLDSHNNNKDSDCFQASHSIASLHFRVSGTRANTWTLLFREIARFPQSCPYFCVCVYIDSFARVDSIIWRGREPSSSLCLIGQSRVLDAVRVWLPNQRCLQLADIVVVGHQSLRYSGHHDRMQDEWLRRKLLASLDSSPFIYELEHHKQEYCKQAYCFPLKEEEEIPSKKPWFTFLIVANGIPCRIAWIFRYFFGVVVAVVCSFAWIVVHVDHSKFI